MVVCGGTRVRVTCFAFRYLQKYSVWSTTIGPTDLLYVPMGYVVVERYMNKGDIYGLRECAIVDPSFISELLPPLVYVKDSLSRAVVLAKKAKDQDVLASVVADQFVWRQILAVMTKSAQASRQEVPVDNHDLAESLDGKIATLTKATESMLKQWEGVGADATEKQRGADRSAADQEAAERDAAAMATEEGAAAERAAADQKQAEAKLAAEAIAVAAQRGPEAEAAAAMEADEAKAVADAKAAEEAKAVADANAAEEAKATADAKAAEEAKAADDAKAAEEEQAAADAKKAEEAKAAADAKAAEEEKEKETA